MICVKKTGGTVSDNYQRGWGSLEYLIPYTPVKICRLLTVVLMSKVIGHPNY